ncbi:Rab3 GTPase-activating protein non-catalytic subunit [Rhynchospora pubera]|uniref:Rab3 GTPase-activating protein non-catalytic subunit n=1 Tax=Rhynchospora pubera TaxID=906938 RepID=A0AAV8G1G8_9POAL|nr:Rab3 GTPase-activating protein non-catalytic subunit [Rhynchospora pubera]
MARRSQLREVCALALASEMGMGIEGWLDDPSLLVAIAAASSHFHLALAHTSTSNSKPPLILVLASSPPPSSSLAVTTRIRPSLAQSDGSLSAIEWLPFLHHPHPVPVLAVGTTTGFLLFFSLSGHLIHKQSIYPATILTLKFRHTTPTPESPSDQLSLVLPGIIARFDSSHLQAMLQKWSDHTGSTTWKTSFHEQNDEQDEQENSFPNLPFQLWNVSKFGSCADAAIVGLMPPPLLELQSSQRYYCSVTIGEDSVISAYRLSEDRSRSLVSAILSRVGTATISTISSFSSIIWRREPSPTKKARPKPQSFAKASPLTCVKDPPRRGERLTLSPSGTLAAVTDSLGRILLLDTQALVVVRLWKGYRDAHCLFVEMLTKKEKSTTSSNYYGYSKNDYCLCLAIHAPRKGIIEIWQMRTGPRLLTIQCPKGSKMLQPSIRFSSSNPSYNPLEVYLLNGDSGQLFVLNQHIS